MHQISENPPVTHLIELNITSYIAGMQFLQLIINIRNYIIIIMYQYFIWTFHVIDISTCIGMYVYSYKWTVTYVCTTYMYRSIDKKFPRLTYNLYYALPLNYYTHMYTFIVFQISLIYYACIPYLMIFSKLLM